MSDPELARALGHAFADPEILERALTHSSYARMRDGDAGNERMEFLGDAVLDLVVSRGLYEAHPDWEEGVLTRARAALVNTESLAERAVAIGLDRSIRLGQTELQSRGQEKPSILANVFEAVVAALYLDGGLPVAEAFVRRVIPEACDPAAPPPERDPKTRLNEWAHRERVASPRYVTVNEAGEEAGALRFEVEALVGGEAVGFGVGPSKREAERAAARAALASLGAPPE
ncbi:MAG: ribonuclease III [Myxococcota bacterium]|nr:ribonuclease III [Myxococcota bacterium]